MAGAPVTCGGCAPHTPIPDEHALRAAPAHPPALGFSLLWGLRPHAPLGSLEGVPSGPLSWGKGWG